MSGHPDTYKPGGPISKWLDDRLPIERMMHNQFVDFPTPRNLNYMWTFGGILVFCLVAQIVTGIVLAMHYSATEATAFDSVQNIKRNVNYGWLIQPMHMVGAHMFFIAVYLHIFRGIYYGSYKQPREVLRILGVFIFLAMMATAFLGYTLPWGQMSFWGVTVITNLFSAIPFVGETIVVWLWGGYSVTEVTMNRFFSLHYLLPFVIFGLVILHVWALHIAGQNNPTGVEVRSANDTVPMSPYAVMKDIFALAVFLILFAWFIFFAPDYLGHADNYIPADPLVTPAHIVPEWYFLPFYAILRAVPDKLGGVVLMFSAVLILLFLPWLDTSRVKSSKYRPIYKWFFWGFAFSCVALGYLGAMPAEGAYVFWARVFTFYYFAFFLIIMPVVGIIETPKKLPSSISEAVLGKGEATSGGGPIGQAAPAAPEKR
jgi:ubiquinol-cytochrome c reductase cytochrome b/c1 subunit